MALLAVVAAPMAQADVWGYIDDRGVAHLASERIDARYSLFFRGGRGFDTAQDLAEEVPVQGAEAEPLPHHLQAFFDTSPAYRSLRPLLREQAQAHRIDYELLKAVIVTESGFDPQAVSPKGAVGLMQVMPATAVRWGLRDRAQVEVAKQLTQPRTNLRIGARYLRHLIDRFAGRLDLALAAYNAGEGAVERAGNRIPAYRETQAYVRKVLALYASLQPQAPAALAQAPRRVRMELPAQTPAPPAGGAIGRGNMPPAVHAALPALPDKHTD